MNERCGIARLVDIVMHPRNVTVVAGMPGSGRTTMLAAMVRYAAKNGASAIYATNDETREDAQRRFAGMDAEAAARVRINGDPSEGIYATDVELIALDVHGVTLDAFGGLVRAAKATNVNAATIIGMPISKAMCGFGQRTERELDPEYAADVLLELTRDEGRTDAHVVVTVAKNRHAKPGQRFVFQFTPNGLTEAT
jgi:KaiC/GvpD/RAD55 family RecA-like ATPase